MKKNRDTQVFGGKSWVFVCVLYALLCAVARSSHRGEKIGGGELFCGKSVCYIICVLPYVKLL